MTPSLHQIVIDWLDARYPGKFQIISKALNYTPISGFANGRWRHMVHLTDDQMWLFSSEPETLDAYAKVAAADPVFFQQLDDCITRYWING